MFQPTHPHGVRLLGLRFQVLPFEFQPTHPHGVRLTFQAWCWKCSEFQPTHPHGVRRNFRSGLDSKFRVSTHAPARGATRYDNIKEERLVFQPTHPHGVRRALISHVVPGEMFQPTHPHGVRRASRGQGVAPCQVSTHAPARGATGIRKGQEGDRMSFNPRTRTGCDEGGQDEETDSEVSTHAPARGAT